MKYERKKCSFDFSNRIEEESIIPIILCVLFSQFVSLVVSVDFFFEGWFQSKIRRYSADDLIILRCEKVKKTTIFQYMAGHSMSENLKAAPKTYRLTHAQENYFLWTIVRSVSQMKRDQSPKSTKAYKW